MHALQHNHDELTNLPTRQAFFHRLEEYTHSCRQQGGKAALMVLKLQQLEQINTAYGYAAGDLLLKQLATRICAALRDTDCAARISSNKFGIILGNIISSGHTILAANKILSLLEEPFTIDDHGIDIHAAIGISLFPEHAGSSEHLLRQAEQALAQSISSRSAYNIFSAEEHGSQSDNLVIARGLKKAIYNDELIMHYQPQVDIQKRHFSGLESLVRWVHPEHGMIPPDHFITIAEQTGLITPLTIWTINTALRHCAHCPAHASDTSISINLSAVLLHDPELIDLITNAIEIWGTDPHNLIFEITESAMMVDPELSKKVLNQLHDLGARISIDDFGTGYSSLAYLKQLPVNELKIDKSFVMKMTENEDDHKIVRSIIDLAHNFDLEVVAEGVENEQALERLHAMGCNIGQGYFIGHPMPLDELKAWLGQTRWNRLIADT